MSSKSWSRSSSTRNSSDNDPIFDPLAGLSSSESDQTSAEDRESADRLEKALNNYEFDLGNNGDSDNEHTDTDNADNDHAEDNRDDDDDDHVEDDHVDGESSSEEDEESDDNERSFVSAQQKISLGICAMDKKARSKPMAEILSRLDDEIFEVIIFGDDRILNDEPKTWPTVDVLIAFYSGGFPLDKVEEYVNLRNPFVVNDLAMQRTLMDRRKVYDLLEKSGIDVPRHVYVSRDGYVSEGSGSGTGIIQELEEFDDHIEVNGMTINKPFVEKPVDADNHNVHIYYPQSAGGGCKKLFRKIGNRSSEFYPDINEVRKNGSFIYEEFVETQGTDVKMYTVGPDYGHAEARKSPAVDGKVVRDSDGKEVRFPVILSLREKEIARRIVLVFKQYVCGFDLLRVQENDALVSYCCDVNGWSFVKNSRKYYDDCATLLTEYMCAAVKPKLVSGFSALDPLLSTVSTLVRPITPQKRTNSNDPRDSSKDPRSALQRAFQLVSNSGHGSEVVPSPDRVHRQLSNSSQSSPNSKTVGRDSESMDLEVNSILSGRKSGAGGGGTATRLEDGAPKIRDLPDAYPEPLSRCSSTSSEVDSGGSKSGSANPLQAKNGLNGRLKETHTEELRCVIAVIRHGDRSPKQKLKLKLDYKAIINFYVQHGNNNTKKDLKVKGKKPLVQFLDTIRSLISEIEESQKAAGPANLTGKDKKELHKLVHMRDVLERWKISGLNRKLQLKPQKWNDDGTVKELLLILKWGGNLTMLGQRQAIALGQRFRHESYPDPSGGGILRLHSTFRHDLKIKTSDEGRVMKTAAAFAKGMLELEGELPPILVSLVHKEKDSVHMLDPSGNKEVKVALDGCKEKIRKTMQSDVDFVTDQKAAQAVLENAGIDTDSSSSLLASLKEVRNPRKQLYKIHTTIGELLSQLDAMLAGDQEGTNDTEKVHEGGEGLKESSISTQDALSGIKLYKGESLVELTERWRLLYKKLYDDDDDEFDLTKIPDVHDNVRFDMLHNPHLGLTKTLGQLYELAKPMADCVVPQEYGISTEEKRSIGSTMCRALLEKIKHDLIIAKTDSQVDLRYMIDLSHSADLAINTLGRRIRTRLYFTSESHLHTLLNVLRFNIAKSGEGEEGLISPLTKTAQEMISATSELCYLTQIVMRLFEDASKGADNPSRFRVEIAFSPGATATPQHMSALARDDDATRFNCKKVVTVSLPNLTCDELVSYMDESIKYGKEEGGSEVEGEAKGDDKSEVKGEGEVGGKGKGKGKGGGKKGESVAIKKIAVRKTLSVGVEENNNDVNNVNGGGCKGDVGGGEGDGHGGSGKGDDEGNDKENDKENDERNDERNDEGNDEGNENGGKSNNGELDKEAKLIAKRYFWGGVALLSITMGVGILFTTMRLKQREITRRWSKR